MTALPRVILVGGAPLSGKTSLASALARRFELACICSDDISTAIRAITDARSHPALHYHGTDGQYRDYYPSHRPERLMEDALSFHRAAWPAIQAVIAAHASWSRPCVLEGWGLLPIFVAGLKPQNVGSVFLIPDEDLFERRCRADSSFYEGARDEAGLIQSFAHRSVLFSRMLEASATEHGLAVLRSTADTSVEEAATRALELL